MYKCSKTWYSESSERRLSALLWWLLHGKSLWLWLLLSLLKHLLGVLKHVSSYLLFLCGKQKSYLQKVFRYCCKIREINIVWDFCTGVIKQVHSTIIISDITIEIEHLLMFKIKTCFLFSLIIKLIWFIKREQYARSFFNNLSSSFYLYQHT